MEWKCIKGYDCYYISNTGIVKKQLKNGSFKNLKPWYSSDGYLIIGLTKNGTRNYKSIHRLVAEAFIPNPECKEQVDHINTIRDDNRAENLRWVTKVENMNNPLSINNMKQSHIGLFKGRKFPERCGEGHPMFGKHHSEDTRKKMSEAHKCERPYEYKPIIQYTIDGEFIKKWNCIKDAEKELQIHHSNLVACCKQRRKSAGGYIWKYAGT